MSKSTLVIVNQAELSSGGTHEPTERLQLADPDTAQITVTDLGITRGDGIFETFGVVGGHIQAVQPHLQRLQRSAALLDLPELDLEVLEQAVRLAAAEHDEDEILVKLIITRGIEGSGKPTAWAHAFVGEDYSPRRIDGISVATLDRGYRHDVAQTSPWLLQGAKTLSYAVNKAALREAARRGVDDVIFISSDGYVLEGPTSTVILRRGDTFITPKTDQGILEGTTQHALFTILGDLGFTNEYRYLQRNELDGADGLWLVSSGQQIAPVTQLDGAELGCDHDFTQTLLKHLQSRTS